MPKLKTHKGAAKRFRLTAFLGAWKDHFKFKIAVDLN